MSELLRKGTLHICTPITGKTKGEVLKQFDTIINQQPDIIEWRADFLLDLADSNLVLEIMNEMKSKTKIPILFTIRAEHEGGEKIHLSEEEKVQLISAVCERSAVDIIDYETSNEKKYVKEVRRVSRVHKKKLILSYHNFQMTPDETELVERAKQAEMYGADVAKFAVMPHHKEDVLRLLALTKTIDNLLAIPVVTMSMGDIGGLSRIIGWAYGSIITFGIGVASSAPGQIPVDKLRETIQTARQLIPSWE